MKKKLIDDIKNSPSRFYRVPNDVIRDRRFRDEERMEILTAWESEAADDADSEQTPLLQQVIDAKKELERRSESNARG